MDVIRISDDIIIIMNCLSYHFHCIIYKLKNHVQERWYLSTLSTIIKQTCKKKRWKKTIPITSDLIVEEFQSL